MRDRITTLIITLSICFISLNTFIRPFVLTAKWNGSPHLYAIYPFSLLLVGSKGVLFDGELHVGLESESNDLKTQSRRRAQYGHFSIQLRSHPWISVTLAKHWNAPANRGIMDPWKRQSILSEWVGKTNSEQWGKYDWLCDNGLCNSGKLFQTWKRQWLRRRSKLYANNSSNTGKGRY